MKKTFHNFTILLLVLACLTGEGKAQDPSLKNTDPNTITWHIFDAPPLMIVKGEKKRTGIVDGVRSLLQANLPGREHRELALPYKRFLLYAQNGMNICTAYLFKTSEREQYLTFSEPAIVFPGYEIILHSDTYRALDYPERLSIRDMFEKHRLRLATNKIRSYGAKIDPLLKEFEEQGKISRNPGSTTLVFRLLVAKRSDFMIDFPNRILYWAHELGIDADDYHSIPIQEDYNAAVSYIACPKTPWGKNVIKQVNAVLNEHRQTKKYFDILLRWSPDYHQQEIEELYNTHLLMKK